MPGNDVTRWCFTINNYGPEHVQWLRNRFDTKDFKYIIFKPEQGENGTPHLQGFFITARRFPRGGVLELCQSTTNVHLEAARGSTKQAVQYVLKSETSIGEPVELGDRPCNVVEALQDQLRCIRDDTSKLTPSQISEKYDIIEARYPRYFDKQMMKANRNYARTLCDQSYPEVYWLYGLSGCGKTTGAKAMAKCLGDTYFILDDVSSRTWWDGYEGEEVIICDDVTPQWMTLDFLKSLCDRARETRAPIKGRTTYITAKHILLTSVQSPRDLYSSDELNRRIRHQFALTL
jgi:Predicted ATPase (AAA+ superfamily)